MKIINPSVELITESDPFKKIEMAGRTCYKSEKAITADSARAFYDRLVTNGHFAMLEHATFTIEVSRCKLGDLFAITQNKFLNVSAFYGTDGEPHALVSGNLRALNESGVKVLLDVLRVVDSRLAYGKVTRETDSKTTACVVDINNYNGLPEIDKDVHKYTTMRFICDRGVSHEIVRHRLFSYAMESTRYVNYCKDGSNGASMAFIKPAGYDDWELSSKECFERSCSAGEQSYREMISLGRIPQEARAVLPHAIKTELIVTGNGKEWEHFFNLRSRGTTGAPHPDMKVVADMALALF